MTDDPAASSSELIIYQSEDGWTRTQCRFEGETIWRQPPRREAEPHVRRSGASRRGEKLNLTSDDLAFYDALEVSDSAVHVLGSDTLKTMAAHLTEGIIQPQQTHGHRASQTGPEALACAPTPSGA